MSISELFDIPLWIAATPVRQMEIAKEVLASLPDFAFISLRTYPGPGQNRLIPTATFRQNETGVLFNLIPGGSFQMGFSDKEIQSFNSAIQKAELTGYETEMVESVVNEPTGPVHKVTLQPFLFARFPLRLTEAAAILEVDPTSEDAPYMLEADGEVDMATFLDEDVDNFLAKSGYLLPSESQWE